jgi:hypothetical protein
MQPAKSKANAMLEGYWKTPRELYLKTTGTTKERQTLSLAKPSLFPYPFFSGFDKIFKRTEVATPVP